MNAVLPHVREQRSIAGVGIGLRSPHINELLTTTPDIPWLEILIDNFLVEGGLVPVQLEHICKQYPVTFHGVGLSLGSVDPVNLEYLGKIKRLMRDYSVAWLSEHACFTSVDGYYSHDLLPIPYTEESLMHMAKRVIQVQDFLGARILVENVSGYLQYSESMLSEVEFMSELADRADCYLLVDVNNIYVNHKNLGIDAIEYIKQLPHDRVKEIHLAGFDKRDGYLLDAHNNPVSEPVWELYQLLNQYTENVPSLIEWDNDIPSLQRLLQEARYAENLKSGCDS